MPNCYFCLLFTVFVALVIGRYTDISIRDFVDVQVIAHSGSMTGILFIPNCLYTQVDHTCRKHWDTYVEKLETVDVDHETGCEVVHWIMKFPVCVYTNLCKGGK